MNIPTYFLNEVSLVLFRSSALIARLALPRDTLGANKLGTESQVGISLKTNM